MIRMTSTDRGSKVRISLSHANGTPMVCSSSAYLASPTWPESTLQGITTLRRSSPLSGRSLQVLPLWRFVSLTQACCDADGLGEPFLGLDCCRTVLSNATAFCKGSSAASELWVVLQCRHIPKERL